MSLPYWVAVGKDPHGGVVHQADDGFWRANNWRAASGGFVTEGEAVLAVHGSPPKPKHKRKPKADLPEAMEGLVHPDRPSERLHVRDGPARNRRRQARRRWVCCVGARQAARRISHWPGPDAAVLRAAKR